MNAQSPLYAVARWFAFIGILGVVGAAAFRYAVIALLNRRSGPAGIALIEPALDRAARLGLALSALVLIAAVLRLFAQSATMHHAGNLPRAGYVGAMVTSTLWGRAWLLQVVAAFVAGVGFVMVRRGSLGAWRAVALAAVLLALSAALSGHAAAVPRVTVLAVTADAAHIIGASGWLGSQFFVVAAGIAAAMRLASDERGPAVADLVNAFSPTALLFAGLAGATGVFAAWLHLGDLTAGWGSAYGRTLLLKLAVISVVAGTGAYNWLRVRPALGDEAGVRRVRRSASIEIAVAMVVLAITAVLVATPTNTE